MVVLRIWHVVHKQSARQVGSIRLRFLIVVLTCCCFTLLHAATRKRFNGASLIRTASQLLTHLVLLAEYGRRRATNVHSALGLHTGLVVGRRDVFGSQLVHQSIHLSLHLRLVKVLRSVGLFE